MGNLTKAKLLKFIKIRNKSEFNSNMQFQTDAESCGFNWSELGQATVFPVDNISIGYKWTTPFGILREKQGKLILLLGGGEIA